MMTLKSFSNILFFYHLPFSQLDETKGLKLPRYITFSGTGSKVISITDQEVMI